MSLNQKILTILKESEAESLFKPRRLDRPVIPRKSYPENKINQGNYSLSDNEDLGPKSKGVKNLVKFIFNFIEKNNMPVYEYSLNKRIMDEEEIQEQIDNNWERYTVHVNLTVKCGFPKNEDILEHGFYKQIRSICRFYDFEIEMFEMSDQINIDIDYVY